MKQMGGSDNQAPWKHGFWGITALVVQGCLLDLIYGFRSLFGQEAWALAGNVQNHWSLSRSKELVSALFLLVNPAQGFFLRTLPNGHSLHARVCSDNLLHMDKAALPLCIKCTEHLIDMPQRVLSSMGYSAVWECYTHGSECLLLKLFHRGYGRKPRQEWMM